MSEHLIKIEKLSKTYQMGETEVHALRHVDLDIKKGEFVAIMGASGSGKTTLMNLIGCLDSPTSGNYILDGIDIHSLKEDELSNIRNEKIGFVFQSFYLLPRTTAFENVELPLLYSTNLNAHQRKEKVMAALKTVKIAERAHHFPNQLSGGQQQRVAIARAIVNHALIMLADEPTGNLDSRTSIEVMSVFQELHKNGITVILVTHEMDIAQYASRLIIFKDGKIRSDVMNDKPKNALEDLKNLPVEEDD
ncbi:MAG TPA: ABC transporter ATP-binding protein [Candidatus Cloacimonadota bacterium]|nr:ABC transporter ATP-binding protein [Candidatus Cloacimonadota bacterium]HPM03738.1 ABC transporter ATP-binding protein [Candidatus Cloacimonadota bacterium]